MPQKNISYVIISDKLTFLSKYRQLERLTEEGERKQASLLHLNLIASRQASDKFHEFLLRDTLKYLNCDDEDDVLYDCKQTVLILSLLNQYEEEKCHVGGEEKCHAGGEEKFHMLKLALNQNLAKSFLC